MVLPGTRSFCTSLVRDATLVVLDPDAIRTFRSVVRDGTVSLTHGKRGGTGGWPRNTRPSRRLVEDWIVEVCAAVSESSLRKRLHERMLAYSNTSRGNHGQTVTISCASCRAVHDDHSRSARGGLHLQGFEESEEAMVTGLDSVDALEGKTLGVVVRDEPSGP